MADGVMNAPADARIQRPLQEQQSMATGVAVTATVMAGVVAAVMVAADATMAQASTTPLDNLIRNQWRGLVLTGAVTVVVVGMVVDVVAYSSHRTPHRKARHPRHSQLHNHSRSRVNAKIGPRLGHGAMPLAVAKPLIAFKTNSSFLGEGR
jgi:sterol desaturase/sphingolipid hydroxylase (fatty acid hydroxylase superfamily)